VRIVAQIYSALVSSRTIDLVQSFSFRHVQVVKISFFLVFLLIVTCFLILSSRTTDLLQSSSYCEGMKDFSFLFFRTMRAVECGRFSFSFFPVYECSFSLIVTCVCACSHKQDKQKRKEQEPENLPRHSLSKDIYSKSFSPL
jgi:hypothetical protein